MLLGGMLKGAEYGYRLIFELVDTHSDHVERELTATIAALQPDGVILTPPHSENPLITNLLASEGITFACIGTMSCPGIALTMDDEHAAALATAHLADLGHHRIAFIAGSPEYSLSAWRVAGWKAEMERRGFATEGLMAQGDFSYESGESAARELLSSVHPPTAIIAGNDRMALACLAVARERGLAVPADLSLVSFDNTPIVRFTQPPLTAVDQPVAETASRAVELIILSQRGQNPPSQPVVVEAALVERQSTAPPR
jgi:LacI family transcriptional regulator